MWILSKIPQFPNCLTIAFHLTSVIEIIQPLLEYRDLQIKVTFHVVYYYYILVWVLHDILVVLLLVCKAPTQQVTNQAQAKINK